MEPTAASSLPAGPSLARRLIFGRNPRMTFLRAFALVVVSFVTFTFILAPIRVTGISMEPNYRNNRINFINRLAYLRHGPQRGDVIGIRFSGESRMLLKRVVGLPGERIAFEGGRITVNGRLLDEPYLKFPSDWDAEPVEVGPEEYFVVGDNRSMPKRLHEHGRAERGRILGKTLL
jgi:signal peptidase I